MALIIEETLKEMYENSAKNNLYGIRFPKVKHKFSLQVDNPSLSEDEKILFSNQVVEAFTQESTLFNNNIFTAVVEDDLHNNIVEMLNKLKECDFILTHFSGNVEPAGITHLKRCKLLFTKSHVSYAESAVHNFKLIYSFEAIERTGAN